MLFSIGFLVTFPFDTCFGAAPFHYVRYGTIVFVTFGRDLLLLKFTSRMLGEPLGKFHFWLP